MDYKLYIIIFLSLFYLILYKNNNNNNNDNNKQIEKFDNNTETVVFSDNEGNLISKDRNSVFTKGMIIAWSGSLNEIPNGWSLCDGTNNKPDLRGRFILGLNTSSNRENTLSIRERDQKGGLETVKLEIKHLPSHDHKYNKNTNVCNGNCPGGSNTRFMTWEDGSLKTEKEGGNEFHENMPPFYVLAYIIKL